LCAHVSPGPMSLDLLKDTTVRGDCWREKVTKTSHPKPGRLTEDEAEGTATGLSTVFYLLTHAVDRGDLKRTVPNTWLWLCYSQLSQEREVS
jgi:hypothetical protein